MQRRQSVHSAHAKTMDSKELRDHFLVENIFSADHCSMTYSHVDRIIFGGIMPVLQTLCFDPDLGRDLGVDYFLQRRELGLINVGGAGVVSVDGREFSLESREALYIGQGARSIDDSEHV